MRYRPSDSIPISVVVYLLTAANILLFTQHASAATFAARISPPKFELKAKPGQVLREVLSIRNESEDKSEYVIRTADWDMNEQGGVVIRPTNLPLLDTSCRAWTRIERPKLRLGSRATKRYRFEIRVPAEAQSGECRFAILIAPAPETLETTTMGNINVPIAGQIAVIVYVIVGDAKPILEFKGAKMVTRNGKPTPVIALHNRGNAHGRPFGSMSVKDASGKDRELVVVPFPILPGRTTDVALQPHSEGSGGPQLRSPVSLKGLIEWDGGDYRVNTVAR